MAQLKDTVVNGGLVVTGDMVLGSSEINVEESLKNFNLFGKKLFIQTREVEHINSTGYHGVLSGNIANDYSDFVLSSNGAYLTYNGTKSCIVSGFINVKLVKSDSDYVHLYTGIYNDSIDETRVSLITPSLLDSSGRWYMIPFTFTVNNGDKLWFLWTHGTEAYVKVEAMHFNLKIDSYI